jgi:hypothetical protein
MNNRLRRADDRCRRQGRGGEIVKDEYRIYTSTYI